jgi:hypothetical protein
MLASVYPHINIAKSETTDAAKGIEIGKDGMTSKDMMFM